MANATNQGSLQLLAMRVSKLDVNGDAIAGASNGYITSSLIEASIGVDIENGVEILKKTADDNICINYRGDDRIKRASMSLKLCQLDSELMSLLIGSPRIINGTTTIGGRLLGITDAAPYGTCVEFWTKAWSGSNQAQPTVLGSVNAYWHWVMPKSKWQLDPTDLKDDAAEISLKGFGYENNALNIDGPFNDWGTSVAGSGGFPSALGWFLDATLPTAQNGFVTVPAQGS